MYVDARLIDERIYVSSYDKNGERQVTTHLPPYVFYYEDPNGRYTSVYGDKLNRKRFTDMAKFNGALMQMRRKGLGIFESDINPVYRLLEERYPGNETPPIKISFIDIEADKDPSKGWTSVASPYAIINAITIYNKWEDQFYTIAVTPPTMSRDEAIAKLAEDSKEDSFGSMTEEGGYLVAHSEADLLMAFLMIIQDADVLTGWNSTFFDLPYIIQRLRIVLGGEKLGKIESEDGDKKPFRPSEKSKPLLERLNLFPTQPRMRMVERFGGFEKTFDIFGRVHLDYLELYRKFTFEELHSYTLDAVLQKEISQTKVAYEGTLDKLYREDFRTFVAYNRQDVAGLSALDDKLKMIQLANTMAHMAGVTFDKVFGSVAIIEQAILKKLHQNNRICFDKESSSSDMPIPGAFVVDPEKGLYEWVCSFDINSLYPSVIRSLNISPEVVVGQLDTTKTFERLSRHMEAGATPTEAWGKFTGVLEYHEVIDESDEMVTLLIEGTENEITATGKEWKERLRENNWALSANGTVFDLSQEGIVSQCLTEWYQQRVEWKGKIKECETDDEKQYYDMLQQVMKIFLNSTYGAYLNKHFRFYDPRLGASVTLSGRVITKHMCKYASKIMTGNYDFDTRAVIYGDTDSSYCTLDWYMGKLGLEKTKENAIKIADELGEKINTSFPDFMAKNFLVSKKRGEIIQAGREVVARRGLFKDVKKRYALHVIDNEGSPADKMKIMGMEVRRSDTPKFIQEFLEKCLASVVKEGKSYDEVREFVEDFRHNVFRNMEPWERGTPCRVSALTANTKKLREYQDNVAEGYINVKKPVPHYSVVAAANTNELIEQMNEHNWDFIRDGDKIEVLYLRGNPMGIKSVAVKVEQKNYIPDWFKDLPFDNERHEQKLLNRKLSNVLGSVMDWDFEPVTDYRDEVFEEVDFFD